MRRTPESRLPHDGSLRTARTDLGERGLDPFDGSPVGALEAPAGGAFDVSAGRGASEGGGHHGLGIRLAFEEGDLGEEEPGFETSQGDALGQDLVGAGPGRFDVTSSQEEGGQAAQRHASVNRHGRRNFHGLAQGRLGLLEVACPLLDLTENPEALALPLPVPEAPGQRE